MGWCEMGIEIQAVIYLELKMFLFLIGGAHTGFLVCKSDRTPPWFCADQTIAL